MLTDFGAVCDLFKNKRDVFGVIFLVDTCIFVLKLRVFRVVFAKFVIFDGRTCFMRTRAGTTGNYRIAATEKSRFKYDWSVWLAWNPHLDGGRSPRAES